MSDSNIPEEYVTLVQVLAEDMCLKEWFESLSTYPPNRRFSELERVATQFHNAGEDGLARVVRSLNEGTIYLMIKEVTDAFQKR